MSIRISGSFDNRGDTLVSISDGQSDANAEIYVDRPTDLQEVPTDSFRESLDKAVEFEAAEIRLRDRTLLFRHQEDGQVIPETPITGGDTLRERAYTIEPTTLPVKVYMQVKSRVSISEQGKFHVLDLHEPTQVQLGARSFHAEPTSKITVTDAVEDVYGLLSALGPPSNAPGCEHSYPTRRTHPPKVELGEEFSVPDDRGVSDSRIELHLPADSAKLYPAAPLAYYLGATVTEGEPRLVTDSLEYRLDQPRPYEVTVNRLLQHVLFLDCLVSNRRLNRWTLDGHATVAAELDADFDSLYEQSRAEQLESYLSVPFNATAKYVTPWHLAVDVAPTPKTVRELPFIAYDLALVRVRDTDSLPATCPNETSAANAAGATQYLSADALGQACVGGGFKVNAEKLTASARLRTASSVTKGDSLPRFAFAYEGPRDVDGAAERFTKRNWAESNVTLPQRVTPATFREWLGDSHEFVAYVGQVDEHGVKCEGAYLDSGTLASLNTSVLLLVGVDSFERVEPFVDAGVESIVATGELPGSLGVDYSRMVGMFLLAGFPVRTAAALASRTIDGNVPFVIAGNGWTTTLNRNSGCPALLDVSRSADGKFEVTVQAFTGPGYEIGSVFAPEFGPETVYSLIPGAVGTFVTSVENLGDELWKENVPLRFDGELYLTTGFEEAIGGGT